MTVIWISLAIFLLAGAPAFMIYCVCVTGSRADQCEAAYVQKINRRQAMPLDDCNAGPIIFFDRPKEFAWQSQEDSLE